jgi:DNA-binding NarL/FixJ family response regulator
MLVDDQNDARNRLHQMLENFENYKVIASTGETDHAVAQICLLRPDIVFLDIEMPLKSGFQIIDEVKSRNVYPTFIFVTAHTQYIIKAIKKSVFDYLFKPINIKELSITLERFMLAKLSGENMIHLPFFSCLGEREKEVMKYAIYGFNSIEIAKIMSVSKSTIDTHRKNILKKTGAKKISDLIIKALADKH